MSARRVAILGARGRMGTEACQAVEEASDLDLVAAVGRGDPVESLVEARAEVAVDLTRPDVVLEHVRFCLERGVHVVVGTSGMAGDRLESVRELSDSAPGVGVLVVPNFSVGAVLMMRFAAQAARHFASAEIVELHHAGKVDAPSGTARRTAEQLASARRDAGLGAVPDATSDALPGARGADVDGIAVHSVRLPGLVAHQEVLFGGESETLTLRHDSLSRASFMPGLLLAVRAVADRPGVTVGLEHVLP